MFNHPEQHCCACGKGASALPPPRPTSDSPTFSSRANAMCNGADSEVRTTTVEGCEAHCERVRCACFHFRRSVCSFALVLATPSLQPTSRGYVAHLRVGAQPPPQLAARHTGAGCASSPQRQGSPPAFYLYEEPALEWGERLSRCFEAARGMPPWALAVNDSAHQRDGAPPIQLAHGLWLYQALRQHPARTRIPERAALYVVPAYGSLSEATGGCDGQTHLNRMEAAASSLRTSPWFKAAPRRRPPPRPSAARRAGAEARRRPHLIGTSCSRRRSRRTGTRSAPSASSRQPPAPLRFALIAAAAPAVSSDGW